MPRRRSDNDVFTRPRVCTVANENCTAPADYEDAYTGGTCHACGLPVCLECSYVRSWRHVIGKVRICDNCYEEEERFTQRLLKNFGSQREKE